MLASLLFHLAKMVIPCEPQIRCMRPSDTTYVAEEVEPIFYDEKINRAAGFAARVFSSSFNHVRLASCRPLVRSRPSQAGAATNWCGFSGSAVQPGLQFSLE